MLLTASLFRNIFIHRVACNTIERRKIYLGTSWPCVASAAYVSARWFHICRFGDF